jgi:hypothetical protein
LHRLTRSSISRAGACLTLLPISCSFPIWAAASEPPQPLVSTEVQQAAGRRVEVALPQASPAVPARRLRGDEDGLARLDVEIAELDGLLAEAHFHTVLALANATRELLDGLDPDSRLASRRAHLEVMTATAQVALGQRARARRSLRRAILADPDLTLDEREISPKVLGLLRELRAQPAAGELR